MNPTESLPEDDDLTVLEYVRRWIHDQINVRENPDREVAEVNKQVHTVEIPLSVKPVFWIGLILLVIGQILLGLQTQSLPVAGLLVIAMGMASLWFGMPQNEAKAEKSNPQEFESLIFQIKPIWLMATLAMSVVCFLLFSENRFGWLQTLSWLTTIACALYAFWPADRKSVV